MIQSRVPGLVTIGPTIILLDLPLLDYWSIGLLEYWTTGVLDY